MDLMEIESDRAPGPEASSVAHSPDSNVMNHADQTTTAEILAEIAATTTTTSSVADLPESCEQLPAPVTIVPPPDANVKEAETSEVVAVVAPASEAAPLIAESASEPAAQISSVFAFDSLANWGPVHAYTIELLKRNEAACSAFLEETVTSRPQEIPAIKSDEHQIVNILRHACTWNILYSYCDIMYVLNPNLEKHIVRDCSLKDLAALIASNYRTNVEMPPEPIPLVKPKAKTTARSVELSKGDEVGKMLQRLREINPHALPAELDNRQQVNAESLMLLDLLSLEQSERYEYILRRAFERKLLCVDEDSQQLVVHARLHSSCWNAGLLSECQKNVAGMVEQAAAAASATAGQSKKSKPVTGPAVAAAVAVASAIPAPVTPVPVGKNAKKKAAKLAKLPETQAANPNAQSAVVEPPKTQPTKKAKAKSKDAFNSNLQDATKSMQRLMVEYSQTRPDCDEPPRGDQRKRNVPGNTLATPPSNPTAAAERDGILGELNRILQRVQAYNNAQLGLLSEPDEFAQFLQAFDRTVAQIHKRLHTEKIPARVVLQPAKVKPTPVANVKVAMPTAATPKTPANFSDSLNQLTEYVTGSYNYRIAPFVSPRDPTDVFADVRNLQVIDKFVAKLESAKLGRVVDGELRVNAFNLVQAYVTSGETAEDTLVESILMRQCALHSDLVRLFVFNPTKRTQERSNPLGFVVRLLEQRHSRIVLGHVTLNKNRNYCMLQPTDRRVPAMRVPKSPNRVLSDESLYEARIVGWTADGQSIGSVERDIGNRRLLATNNEAILISNHLEVPKFPARALHELPDESWQVPDKERARRRDLTSDCVFTIDPATARDLDDALSVRRLPDDTFEVGVHISDVTHFIAENSALDLAIREKTTSIYLVNEVYHMLPRSLCMTCSLLPGQDKLAFSVFWRMNETAEVLGEPRIERTVIRSCAQLSYEHAQRMLDEPDRDWSADDDLPAIGGGFSARDLSERIGWLHRLARPLRQRRFERKCLRINQPKITIRLDETNGEPVAWQRYQQVDSNWLIEEFMLLANQTVAKCIYAAYPDHALLRSHRAPKTAAVKQLAVKLELYGFHIDGESPDSTSESLYALINDEAIPANVMAVLTDWVTRPMNRALYGCSLKMREDKDKPDRKPNDKPKKKGKKAAEPEVSRERQPADDPLWHFALSIPIYTHFTSPIRRYPDVLVHRLLAGALNLGKGPTLNTEDLDKIAKQCNENKYGAKCAGEASTDLYFGHYVRHHGPVLMAAVVTEVMNADMFEVMLLDTGAKLKIVVAKHKPAVRFITNGNQKPLSGMLHFVSQGNTGNNVQQQLLNQQAASSPSLRIEVFRELQVMITATDENILKASIVSRSVQ